MNTYTGGNNLISGTLQASTIGTALGATSALNFSGGTLYLTNATGTNLQFVGTDTTTLTGNGTIVSDVTSNGAGDTFTVGGKLLNIGTETLTIQGGSHVTSGVAGITTGTTVFSGNTTIALVAPDGGAGGSGVTNLTLNGPLYADSGTTTPVSINVIGTGQINMGAGTNWALIPGTSLTTGSNVQLITGSTNALGFGVNVTANGSFNTGTNINLGSLAGASTGTITNTASGSITLFNVGTATYNGSIGQASGAITEGVTMEGVTAGSFSTAGPSAGVEVLAGTSTYTGLTDVTNGTLSLTGTLNGTSGIWIDAPSNSSNFGATGQGNASFNESSTGMIAGTATVTMLSGSGVTTLAGNNTTTGSITIEGGSLVATTSNGALGNGSLVFNSATGSYTTGQAVLQLTNPSGSGLAFTNTYVDVAGSTGYLALDVNANGAGNTYTESLANFNGTGNLDILGGAHVTSGTAGFAIGGTGTITNMVLLNPIHGGVTQLTLGALYNGGAASNYYGNGNVLITGGAPNVAVGGINFQSTGTLTFEGTSGQTGGITG